MGDWPDYDDFDPEDILEWLEDAWEDFTESRRSKALLGGCLFAVLATVAFGLLSSFANVFSSAGGMFLAAWLVGGALIYLYYMRTASKRYREGADFRERHHDRHHEEDRRSDREPEAAPEQPEQAQTEQEPGTANVGDVALLTMAGIGIALAAGFAVTGRATSSAVNAILTGLLGALGAGSVLALLLRWRRSDPIDVEQSDRDVRAQAKRIRGKCHRLRKEAKRAGGVYSDLTWHAREMQQRARELADLALRLRNVLRETAREENPTLPPGASAEAPDETLRQEYEAARRAQARLDAVVERNRQREQMCLSQLERIEDLVDIARLELAHPVTDETLHGAAGTVVEDVEAELEASRRALEEVRGASRLEA